MRFKEINKAWYFLTAVAVIYAVVFFINKNSFFTAGNFFIKILKTIIPVFILVFILMTIINYFVTKKTIIKHFGEKSVKAWFFAVVGGIISHGPIYMWYPLMSDAKEKGVNYGLISCFLYNRAIKIPLLPVIIFYFGIKYVLILLIVMIIMSVAQGIIINKIFEDELKNQKEVKNENRNSI